MTLRLSKVLAILASSTVHDLNIINFTPDVAKVSSQVQQYLQSPRGHDALSGSIAPVLEQMTSLFEKNLPANATTHVVAFSNYTRTSYLARR